MARERKQVLLIEDNEDDAALAVRALSKIGTEADLVVVPDGAEGFKRLFAPEAVVPDLVLLDLKLPLVDGLDVLRRIRLDARTGTVPVVVLSSSLEERDLREAYLRGANSYLRKPVDYLRFVEMMRDVLHYWLELNNLPSRAPEEPAGERR